MSSILSRTSRNRKALPSAMQAFAHAGEISAVRKGIKLFTSGLLFGLSSSSLFLAGELRGPKASPEGLASDWRAVGEDIKTATSRYGR